MSPLRKIVWVFLLLFVFVVEIAHVRAADEEPAGTFPWGGEAAQIAGRILAIRHVLDARGARASRETAATPTVMLGQELAAGPVGTAFTGAQAGDQLVWTQAQLQLQQWQPAPRQDQMLSRVQEQQWQLASRRDQMLSRIQDQQWQTALRRDQMLSRIQDQQWQTALRRDQMLSRIQDQQWQTGLRRDQMLSRVQEQQWKTALMRDRQDQMLSRIQQQQGDFLLQQQTSRNLFATSEALQARRIEGLAAVGRDTMWTGFYLSKSGLGVASLLSQNPAVKGTLMGMTLAEGTIKRDGNKFVEVARDKGIEGVQKYSQSIAERNKPFPVSVLTVEARSTSISAITDRNQLFRASVLRVEARTSSVTVTPLLGTLARGVNRTAEMIDIRNTLAGIGQDYREAFNRAKDLNLQIQMMRSNQPITRSYDINFRTPGFQTIGTQTITKSQFQRTINTHTTTSPLR